MQIYMLFVIVAPAPTDSQVEDGTSPREAVKWLVPPLVVRAKYKSWVLPT